MLNYNYVFFNSGDGNGIFPNKDGYFTICTKDLEQLEGVVLVQHPLDSSSLLLRILFKIHNTYRINQIINLPLRDKWYPLFFKNTFKDDKPIVFVILDRLIPEQYLHWLKKQYPNCKIVRIKRDLVKIERTFNPDFDRLVKEVYDLLMLYDAGEAQELGCPFFDEFESKIDVPISSKYPECDVFFAGYVKKRLPKLMTIYNKLTEAGLSVNYYLMGVPAKDQIPYKGITYATKCMTYREMLYHTVNCRCVLDVNQDNAIGYTSRFLEAVMYNKLLIADNQFIKESKFYNPDYIQIYDDWADVDPDFIKLNNKNIDFNYKDEFSPIHLLEKIDIELSNL